MSTRLGSIAAPLAVALLWAGCAGEIAPATDAALVDRGRRDAGGTPDSRTHEGSPQVDLAPGPDTGLKSYGSKCTWTGKATKCSDGKSDCIPNCVAPAKGTGYCSIKCKHFALCPNPRDTEFGTHAMCLYSYNNQPYCVFLCLLQGKTYVCPKGFNCYKITNDQSFCWPM